jgi:hypothetical protein
MRKTSRAAFDPFKKLIRPIWTGFFGGFFAQNRSQGFCGKYVFGVPLGEASGVLGVSRVAPGLVDPSFATPSLSVGNWLAGCRSHAPSASDKVAIRTKNFFIELCI